MNKTKTAAICGYKASMLPNAGDDTTPSIIEIKEAIKECIVKSINDGFDTFLIGMEQGFDTYAAEIVFEQKREYPIKIITAIPYKDHYMEFHNEDLVRYNNLLDNCDEVIVLSNKKTKGTYNVRNRFLIDNSNKLICYYDGRASDTEYTYLYAIDNNIIIENIAFKTSKISKPVITIDNKRGKKVYEELSNNLRLNSKLSVISAYFTIYAFEKMKEELSRIESMRFIFTEPTFVNNEDELIREYYIDNRSSKILSGNRFEIKLKNEMKQAHIAKECAEWLAEKVEIKSLLRPNPAQPRFIHMQHEYDDTLIHGTVDFSTDGLGITNSDRLDSNLCMYGKAFTENFLMMFNELWSNNEAVKDVKLTLPHRIVQIESEDLQLI